MIREMTPRERVEAVMNPCREDRCPYFNDWKGREDDPPYGLVVKGALLSKRKVGGRVVTLENCENWSR